MNRTHVASRCPKCSGLRVVTFLRVELLELLAARRPINCVCQACNEIWPINPTERGALMRELDGELALTAEAAR